MSKKKSLEDRFMEASVSAVEAGETLSQQRNSGGYSLVGRDSRRSLREIKPRPGGNTRELDPKHIFELADSIAALGLLQPIAIDKENFLVAGEHRLEACRLLSLEDTGARKEHWKQLESQMSKKIRESEALELLGRLDVGGFNSRYKDAAIPVLVLPFKASEDTDQALAAEAAENEKRRNYTKDEIKTLAVSLKKRGFIDGKGRPKIGEKSLHNALALLSGKSVRQIRRDLEREKIRTHVLIFDERKAVAKIQREIENFLRSAPEDNKLRGMMTQFVEEVGEYLKTSK
ncbi:MAG: ParB N-terminal domain-containing protein [Desulfamplus sp.]|nr:ParB N-terminal domain-containing protein [Desulfamplus sp.]